MSPKDDQELLDELKRLVTEMLADLNGRGSLQGTAEQVLAADTVANDPSRRDLPRLMTPRRKKP